MADAVGDALRGGTRLIAEAGTGTGKSLAYLVPLAEFAMSEERRAVVSTYTKALQRQLVEKDLPFLRENLFEGLRFALCLGSENYLCLRRLDQAGTYGLFTEENEDVERLFRWAKSTRTGLWDGINRELWRKVLRESDLCHGRQCRYFTGCFYQRAKEKERRAHILVVNHHLYFANLASGLNVLPQFGTAVFDEAHEIEDVASDYLGLEVSNFRMRHLFNCILGAQGRGLLTRLKWLDPSDFSNISAMVNTARTGSERFFSKLSPMLERPTLRIWEKDFIQDNLSEHLMRLHRELDGLKDSAGDEEEKMELGAMALRCEATAEALKGILAQELPEHVYWAEKSGRMLRIAATPVDIGGMQVFEDLEAAVFTSATLSTASSFQYIRERLGLMDAGEIMLRSHFNYRDQARLYIASDLPVPNSPGFEEKVIDRIGEMIRMTGGRTLVLFTSYSLLNMAFETVRVDGVDILRQGDADSYRLVEEFREGHRTALFGTYTFWQGIDIPGEALECVIITKLPFAVPDEPVVEARMQKLSREGKSPFYHYQVPQAALMLKQGFGRLIRTSSDRGVVAILDSRTVSKPYGRIFLDSLPECGKTTDLDEIASFINGAGRPAGN
jgi:ATP-dependent DNA helicase DinG